MSRWCNGGARKITRHLWFQLVRWSGFPDDVMPAQFVLNLLHLLNRVSVITIHITGLMRHMAFTLWMLRSHLRDYSFNRLSQFSLFHLILSDQFKLRTMRRFSMKTHLSHTLLLFTNTCLPHGKPCFIKPNFILDSSFPCCAWLCCHTHAPSSCYASATTMWLHHAFNLCYACPRQYQ